MSFWKKMIYWVIVIATCSAILYAVLYSFKEYFIEHEYVRIGVQVAFYCCTFHLIMSKNSWIYRLIGKIGNNK